MSRCRRWRCRRTAGRSPACRSTDADVAEDLQLGVGRGRADADAHVRVAKDERIILRHPRVGADGGRVRQRQVHWEAAVAGRYPMNVLSDPLLRFSPACAPTPTLLSSFER